MNFKNTYNYKKSVEIFEIHNTFLQSPFFKQLLIFFWGKVPEGFLPIEKTTLIDGLSSFGYHVLRYLPEKDRNEFERSVMLMINTIERNFVSDEEFVNFLFVNIQNNNKELLTSGLDNLRDYQKKSIVALDKECFLKSPDCSVRVLNGAIFDFLLTDD